MSIVIAKTVPDDKKIDWTHVADLGDPSDCDWFRSLDWGRVNPGDVLWWSCLPDVIYYIRYEWKYDHLSIPRVAENIVEKTSNWGIPAHSIRYTVADPAIWGLHGEGTKKNGEGEMMDETFARCGLPLIRGDNDRKSGWQRIVELLEYRDDGRPNLIIHPSCRYLIRSLAEAVSSKNDPEDIDTHSDDHALDTLRYGAMSRPSPTRRNRRYSRRSFKGQMDQLEARRRMLTVR
jgi:hypothetical protein